MSCCVCLEYLKYICAAPDEEKQYIQNQFDFLTVGATCFGMAHLGPQRLSDITEVVFPFSAAGGK